MIGRRGETPGVERTAPAWVKILVGLHVFCIVVWALPRPADDVMTGKVDPQATKWLLYWNAKYLKEIPPLQAYLLATGGWQYWDMFAPDPANTDWYGDAEVTFRDGTTRTVPYPRMADLPIPLKYVKERYRKFYERAHDDKQFILFPAFAQAMALRATTDPNNLPKLVRLRRYAMVIADPGKPQPKAYDSGIYYTYAVDEAWLKRALKR